MHCILKVESHKGGIIKAAVTTSENFEKGEEWNRLIEDETEFRIIADEFKVFQSICMDANEVYCHLTIEMANGDETLIEEVTVSVPRTAQGELMNFLVHVKELCRSKVEDFLSEERGDGDDDIKRAIFKIPAFFWGNINKIVMH